jgi:pyrroloquinoline quinone biosynthesis protein E
VKERSLHDIWHHDFSFNHFRGDSWMPSPCKDCDEKDKDFGGCRCQAYLLTGDMYKTDPVCSKSPDHHLMKGITDKAGTAPSKALQYRKVEKPIPILEVSATR